MITLYNRLTSNELADYSSFSHIIDDHYEKFKYLYYILKDVDLDKIADITCSDDEECLSVTIAPNDVKNTDPIVYSVNSRKYTYKKSDYFKIDVSWYDNAIHINISMSGDEKEGEIYANRFI